MPPAKHALLGASKAHQWMTCTPSAQFEKQFEAPAQSEAAAEGTVAHTLAEHHLTKILQGKKVTTPSSIKKDPLYKPAMEEHVGVYCDTIMETLNGMREAGQDPIIYLEQELDLSKWIPEGFGTADCILIGNGVLHVFDFKYGKGIPVSAEENPQLKLYGLGALEEFSCLYEINDIVLHIIQPRLQSITDWTVSREILEKWGEFIVKPTAQKAYNGEGDFVPGEDQCRWCLGKNRCRAYNQWLLEVCQMRFDDLDAHEKLPNELSDQEIADILKVAEEIKRWVSAVGDYALDQALNHGVTFPGYKLVEGVSRRKITNEEKVIDILREQGYSTEQICKLKGITDLEEVTGKSTLQTLIGDYIVKPQGKPTLAPEDDKRKPYTDLKFTEVKENETNE